MILSGRSTIHASFIKQYGIQKLCFLYFWFTDKSLKVQNGDPIYSLVTLDPNTGSSELGEQLFWTFFVKSHYWIILNKKLSWAIYFRYFRD